MSHVTKFCHSSHGHTTCHRITSQAACRKFVSPATCHEIESQSTCPSTVSRLAGPLRARGHGGVEGGRRPAVFLEGEGADPDVGDVVELGAGQGLVYD